MFIGLIVVDQGTAWRLDHAYSFGWGRGWQVRYSGSSSWLSAASSRIRSAA